MHPCHNVFSFAVELFLTKFSISSLEEENPSESTLLLGEHVVMRGVVAMRGVSQIIRRPIRNLMALENKMKLGKI